MPQMILADYSMPAFNALRALKLLRQRQLDIPFIVVTGTISEETAVQCIKEGADDYLIKDRLARLGPAILHALEEKRLRDEKRLGRSGLAAKRTALSQPGRAFARRYSGRRPRRPHRLRQRRLRPAARRVRQKGAARPGVSRLRARRLPRASHPANHTKCSIRACRRRSWSSSSSDWTAHWSTSKWPASPASTMVLRRSSGLFATSPSAAHAQEEARQRLAELTHVIRLTTMGELVSELAHEINQPLYAISNFAEACLNRFRSGNVDQAEIFSWIEKIATQANRAGEILRRVGQFVRKSPPRQVVVDINESHPRGARIAAIRLAAGPSRAAHVALPSQLPTVKSRFHSNRAGARESDPQRDRSHGRQSHAAIGRWPCGPSLFGPIESALPCKTPDAASIRPRKSRLFEPFFTTKSDGMGMGLAISQFHHPISRGHAGSDLEFGSRFDVPIHAPYPCRGGSQWKLMNARSPTSKCSSSTTIRQPASRSPRWSVRTACRRKRSPRPRNFWPPTSPSQRGCLVVDVRMTGMTGLELQQELTARGYRIPVIVITGFADVPTAVRAMRAGAVTFLEKPCSDKELWASIETALGNGKAAHRQQRAQRGEIAARRATLTPAEVQVLERLLAGKANKTIAVELDLGLRTVELRRATIMKKMEANSLAELVRLILSIE